MASETTDAQPAKAPNAQDASEAAYGGSYFVATHGAMRDRSVLSQDIDVDVCVVGAGLAGLTVAREVARKGWTVAVLEAKRVAWNASGRNTGFVLPGFAQDAQTLVDRVGLDATRELWGLAQSGLDYVRETVAESRMQSMEQSEGWLHISKTDRAKALRDETELLRNLGADVEFWPESLVRSKVKCDNYFQAVHYPAAFSIHPLNYALGLAELAEQSGARIFENTEAVSIDPAGVRKRITTATGRVRAGHIVLAGNTFMRKLTPELSKTLIPIHTYVIVTKPLGPELAETIDYPGAISDTDRADNHYRIIGGDRLMWAGRMTVWDSRPGRFGRRLRRDLRQRFPQLKNAEVDYAWTGELGMTVHRMPQIGEVSSGVWLANGFAGHGLNTTAMAGQLIARAIIENDDRWRQFQPFELVWAGGRSGRILVQGAYWGRREIEKWASKRARARELHRIKMEPILKERAVKLAEKQRIAAEHAEEKRILDEQRAVERAEAARIRAGQEAEKARIKAEQRAEAARVKAEQKALRLAEKERLAAEKAEAERLEAERRAADQAAAEAARIEAERVAAEEAAVKAAEAEKAEAERAAAEEASRQLQSPESEVAEAGRASAEDAAAEENSADPVEADKGKKKKGWFGRG
jgi:glycine/D-amino acid oxidase-like deaminating enzyme